MAIDLSRINISLDQFQKMATGDFNAGEVKLKSESTLTKINNHVHRLGANKTAVAHEEVLAIKNAFVKALSAHGVASDEINHIRKELGLAPDETAPKALAWRSLKPLSRQQIRDIIDRNANAINAARAERGERAFKTSDQLYGTNQTKLNNLAAYRRAASDSVRRTQMESTDIANFQKIVEGDAAEVTDDNRKATLKMIMGQRNGILAQCKNNPSQEGACVLEFETSGGAKLQFSTGKSQLDTVKMLDEAYLRLAHGAGTAKRNAGIAEAFMRENEKIPFEFRQMAMEVREEATNIFGKESVNQKDDEIGFLVRAFEVKTIASEMTKKGVDLTPENMRAHFREACMKKSSNNFLIESVNKTMAEAGIAGAVDMEVCAAMKARHPDLAGRLANAKSADEAKQIIDGLKDEIAQVAAKCSHCETAKAQLTGYIQEAFAKEMGAEWKSGDRELVNMSKLVGSKGNALAEDILADKVAASDKAAIEAEFKALAANLAHGRAEQLRQVDALGLPADSAYLAKRHLMNNNDTRNLKVDLAFQLSRDIDVKGLADAFRTNAPKEKIYQELEKFSQDAGGKLQALFAGAEEVGGEENMLGIPVMMYMALGKEPELATQYAKFFARPDVQADRQEFGTKMPVSVASLSDYVNNERLMPADIAATLGKPGMNPLFSQALSKAVDEMGPVQQPPGGKHALFAEGTAAGRSLRKSLQVLGAQAAITPEILYGLAKEALRVGVDKTVDGTSPAAHTMQTFVLDASGAPENAPLKEKLEAFDATLQEETRKDLINTFTYLVDKHLVKQGEGGKRTENFDAVHGQFDRDLVVGGMTVNLPGGGTLSTKNYATARDQLVQFITGDANATYKTASANVKKQTGLLMSILTQCGPSMAKNGFISTLQKAGHEYTLSGGRMMVENAHEKPMTWTLGKAEDGSIKATVTQTGPLGFLFTAQGPMQLDDTTSYEETTLDITIPADNLASLADQDWSTFDPAPYNAAGKDPDAQLAAIPQQFRLAPTVTATYHLHLDAPPAA